VKLALWALVAAVVAGSVPVAVSLLAPPAVVRAAQLPVLGYAESGTPSPVVDASTLATVGVDGVNITADGTEVSAPDDAALELLAHARTKNLPAELLIGNYSSSLNDFDPAATHALVSSPANIDHVVSTLADAVRTQGWSGIGVDLESIRAEDTDGLVDFVTALKAALPAGKTVDLAVMAFTSAQEYPDNGYDLARLGTVLDRIELMAYDQHGPWSDAGPIGGLPWQEQALKPVLAKVPAAKVDLGVAGYGYTWSHGSGGQVADAAARDLVEKDDSTAQWDETQGEWNATLHDGTILWWSDAKSWPLRETLADRYHLHGLALWSLGLSDPITQ
jgi:spore germination protein